MAILPTPEETARKILEIFVHHFNGRPGHGLHLGNFMAVLEEYGLHHEDFQPGMVYAAEQGWIEIRNNGTTFLLTEIGFSESV